MSIWMLLIPACSLKKKKFHGLKFMAKLITVRVAANQGERFTLALLHLGLHIAPFPELLSL